MRLQLSQACLDDDHEGTRKSGVVLLAEEESPEADFLLVRSMADRSETVWRAARDVLLHRSPWLALEPAFVRPVPERARGGWRGMAWGPMLQGLRHVVRELDPGLDVLKRFLTVPAVIPDLLDDLRQYGLTALAAELAAPANHGNSRPARSRQILLAPTYRCNLSCSYCYARNFSNGFPPDMSLEDLAAALSWAAAQGVDSVVLCGGEPTTYRHFPQLLQMAKARNISVHLTSNCLYAASQREHIAASLVCELVAHYDQERMRSDHSATQHFIANLQAARSGGLEVLLRYTLTEESGPTEWRVLMDLAQRLSIGQINYALAFRGSEGLNTHFQYRAAIGAGGGRLEDILNGLCDDAADRGLRLHLSKPIPLCALTPASLRRVFREGGMRSACAVYRDGFTRNLTINPDLSTFPCNGIATRGPRITELSSLADAGRHHAKFMEDLMSQPYDEECRCCALWYRGLCQGACLAEHYWMSRAEKKRPEEGS